MEKKEVVKKKKSSVSYKDVCEHFLKQLEEGNREQINNWDAWIEEIKGLMAECGG